MIPQRPIICALGLLLVGGSGLPVSAASLRVPEDFSTVLAAVDAAAAGDSVLIGPGTWDDVETRDVPLGGGTFWSVTSCAFLKGGLTLIGTGPGHTTLEHGGIGDWRNVLVYPTQPPGGPVRIEGLTLVGGPDVRGLLAFTGDGIEIRNCVIRDCDRGAVDVDRCDLVIEDSVIRDNASTYTVNAYECSLEIRRCEFLANEGISLGGTQGFSQPYTAIIEDCRFENSGSVQLSKFWQVHILRNVFTQTTASSTILSAIQGGDFPMNGSIAYNVFDHIMVDPPLFQGCVRVSELSGDVSHNTWSGCGSTGAWAVGTFSLMDGGSFRNNVVAGSTGAPAVAVVGEPGGTIDVGCNDFWDNAEGNFTEDYPADAEDFFVDPLFCDAENGDLTLQSASFLAAENNPPCGQIGALGVGCGTVSIQPETWARIKVMVLVPAMASAQATWVDIPIEDVRILSNGSGEVRVLLDPGDLARLSSRFVESAVLVIPMDGQAVPRDVDLRVYPITTNWRRGAVTWTSPWQRSGGDFPEDRYFTARLTGGRQRTSLEVNITGIVRMAAQEDPEVYGLLVAVPAFRGEGLALDELARFGALDRIVLKVKTRNPPRVRRG